LVRSKVRNNFEEGVVSKDELIFLGAAILLSQKGRDPDATELRTAAEWAFKLHEEVKKQDSDRQANQPLPLFELAKEKAKGRS
jgi:hypothetical protein